MSLKSRQESAVVRAVNTYLDQDAAGMPVASSMARCVQAGLRAASSARHERMGGPGADHVGVGIDRTQRDSVACRLASHREHQAAA